MKANYCTFTGATEGFHHFQTLFSCEVKGGERKRPVFTFTKAHGRRVCQTWHVFSFGSPLYFSPSCCIMSLSGLKRALAVQLCYRWHFAAEEEEEIHFSFEDDIRIILYFLLIIFLSGAAGHLSSASSEIRTSRLGQWAADMYAQLLFLFWEKSLVIAVSLFGCVLCRCSTLCWTCTMFLMPFSLIPLTELDWLWRVTVKQIKVETTWKKMFPSVILNKIIDCKH